MLLQDLLRWQQAKTHRSWSSLMTSQNVRSVQRDSPILGHCPVFTLSVWSASRVLLEMNNRVQNCHVQCVGRTSSYQMEASVICPRISLSGSWCISNCRWVVARQVFATLANWMRYFVLSRKALQCTVWNVVINIAKIAPGVTKLSNRLDHINW